MCENCKYRLVDTGAATSYCGYAVAMFDQRKFGIIRGIPPEKCYKHRGTPYAPKTISDDEEEDT